METKSTISLVSVQKPSANTPILQRRSKFAADIDNQILKIGSYRDGKRVSREKFWLGADGSIYFQMKYGKQPLELQKGKSTLKSTGGWDDIIAQLDEVKIITLAGGLDDALAVCANSVRANFKAAKDKKSPNRS